MKYLKTFEGFNISEDDMMKYVHLPQVSHYLKDECSILKTDIEYNDIERFKSKMSMILKNSVIFSGIGQSGDDTYVSPVWPYSLERFMNLILIWCIEQGADIFVDYLLNIYNYSEEQIDYVNYEVSKYLDKLDNDLYSNKLKEDANRCLNKLETKKES